ncbi:MAG: hypothetical protein JXA11_15435 [Phycisphaerae bacterium]|nr:hypothetical protein [Phycisphaerae bacterium]
MAIESVSATSAASLQANFMDLLVTQLQHQDPLDPMKNEELTMQLATLSQLQHSEEMSAKFSTLLKNFELTEGGKLIGRVVDFIPSTLGERISGLVSGVKSENGTVTLTVGPYDVKLEDVLSVSPYTGQASSGGSETPTQLIGDVNLDNVVDDLDKEILQENFGMTTGATWAQGDLNGDGAVNHMDYTLLMAHYGEAIGDAVDDPPPSEGDGEDSGDSQDE